MTKVRIYKTVLTESVENVGMFGTKDGNSLLSTFMFSPTSHTNFFSILISNILFKIHTFILLHEFTYGKPHQGVYWGKILDISPDFTRCSNSAFSVSVKELQTCSASSRSIPFNRSLIFVNSSSSESLSTQNRVQLSK